MALENNLRLALETPSPHQLFGVASTSPVLEMALQGQFSTVVTLHAFVRQHCVLVSLSQGAQLKQTAKSDSQTYRSTLSGN